MNLRRRAREDAEVESSSLNDIMFFLLLFFLIASTLANPNVIKIMLPKAKTTSTVQTKPLILTVKFADEEKTTIQYYIDNNKTPVSVEELESVLVQKNEEFLDPENPDNRMSVVLRLDRDLTVQQMVNVMEIGANLGIRMVLATDKSR
ncbi:MAG: ExbD/TolR family protein [Bacteroidia bacterium]